MLKFIFSLFLLVAQCAFAQEPVLLTYEELGWPGPETAEEAKARQPGSMILTGGRMETGGFIAATGTGKIVILGANEYLVSDDECLPGATTTVEILSDSAMLPLKVTAGDDGGFCIYDNGLVLPVGSRLILASDVVFRGRDLPSGLFVVQSDGLLFGVAE